MPSASARTTMLRRERGRDLMSAGYTLTVPSNASMRAATGLFFHRLDDKMIYTANFRANRRSGGGQYDSYNERMEYWYDYGQLENKWTLGGVAKGLSKSICYLLRHADPCKSGRDAGGWVPIEKVLAKISRDIRKDFEGALEELLMWLCTLPEGKGGRYQIAMPVLASSDWPFSNSGGRRPTHPTAGENGGGAQI